MNKDDLKLFLDEYKFKRQFSNRLAFSHFLRLLNYKINSKTLQKYSVSLRDKSIIKYISKYLPAFESYNNADFDHTAMVETQPIFVCWLQGVDNAPQLVKNCIDTIIKNAGSHKVHIISLSNLNDYIDIPDYMMNKYKEKKIIPAIFADYIRVSLLYKYGGLWLDATVFCNGKIPDWIFEYNFFTCKFGVDENMDNISKGRWTGFIIGSKRGYPLFGFGKEFYENYWLNENSLIDYFVMDYWFEIVYRSIEQVKNDMDILPVNNSELFSFEKAMRSGITSDDYRFSDNTFFYKLSWHRKYNLVTEDGRATLYKDFIEGRM